MPGGCRVIVMLPDPNPDITRTRDPAQPGQPVPDTNLNTVDIFASLRALPAYNVILQTAVDLLYEGNHELRVLHVPGEANTVADALSRQNYARAWELQPDLTISEFEPYVRIKDGHRFILSPPRPALGATKK